MSIKSIDLNKLNKLSEIALNGNEFTSVTVDQSIKKKINGKPSILSEGWNTNFIQKMNKNNNQQQMQQEQQQQQQPEQQQMQQEQVEEENKQN